MIRFGMGLMEIVEQLTRGFMKATGKQPGNLEKLKIQQEAVQRFKDMNKVMDMQGRPIDPSKPIIGGSQQGEALKSGIMKATGARPRQVLSEDEIRQKLLKNNEEGLASMKSKIDDPEKKADGGRIGYKIGAGKKGVQALLDLVRDKFGKKAVTTGDKAPIPPKTLERDMFKAADNRINKKEGVFMEDGKTPDYDYYKEILDDAEDSMGFNVAGDETIEELLKREKTLKDYEADMYDQYKTGKLDPEPGSKSQARLNLLKKRKEEAELTDDYRLFSSDDADELDELEEFLDQDYKRVKAEQAEEQAVKELAPKMVERLKLKQKYPGITDDLLDKILIDDNPQRKAEVLGSLDETFKMMEKGMSPDEIIDAFKNQNRTKQADGGIMRANFVGGGMGRRGFLKMLAGLGGGIAAAKTGLLKLAGKEPAKQVAKEVVQKSTNTPPPYFFKLAEKIKTMGDDVTAKAATKDREVVTKFKEYELTEDVATGEMTIQRMKVLDDGSESYYGKPLTEETYMNYKPGKGQADEMTGPIPDEYEEGTALLRNDREYAGDVVDESFKISDDVIEEAMSEAPSIKIKKAGGGIARMLGE